MTCKILIVEDDLELHEIYAAMLDGLGCQIIQARDGGEAMAKLTETKPDLILLDILLDEVMGDDLFRQVKQMPQYADLPVIIVSVLPESRCQELLELDPRTIFLRKPFRREQLLEAIRKNLNDRDGGRCDE